MLRDRALAVVDLIAIGELHDLLRVERRVIERRDRLVGDDVVDEIRAQGAGIAEPLCLDRRRTEAQDVRPRILRVTLEIDGDVDLERRQQRRDLAVALRPHVEKAIERPRQPLADVAAVVGPERHPDRLEARPVVQLDQLRDQVGGGVAVIVGGEISNANLVMLPSAVDPARPAAPT